MKRKTTEVRLASKKGNGLMPLAIGFLMTVLCMLCLIKHYGNMLTKLLCSDEGYEDIDL